MHSVLWGYLSSNLNEEIYLIVERIRENCRGDYYAKKLSGVLLNKIV